MRAPRQPQSSVDGALEDHAASQLHGTRPIASARATILETTASAKVAIQTYSTPGGETLDPHSRPLLFIAAAMAAGIVVDRYVAVSAGMWLGGGAVAIVVWFALTRRLTMRQMAPGARELNRTQLAQASTSVAAHRAHKATDLFAAAVLLAAVAACGGLRHHLHWRQFASEELGRFAREQPQPACLEVVALTSPRLRPAPPPDPLRSVPQSAHSVVRVRAMALRDGDAWRSVDGRATMIVEGTLLGVQAGDRLRIIGLLQAPPPPGNPGEFDFAMHRRGDRELAVVRVDHPDCVRVLETASFLSPRRMFGALRAAGDRLLWGTLSHERAGLASAVLLGAREQLDDDQKDDFLVTGTVHILSISGLHVGILALVLFKAFRTGWIPRRAALVTVAVVTLSYALLTDAEPPAIRATVLVWVVCAATFLGRASLGVNSLALAAIIVLTLNPADLFRTGTQLSFLSVAMLVAIAPWLASRDRPDPLTRLIRRTRPFPVRTLRWVGGSAAALALAGLMIWLVTAPLVAHRFHIVSLSALALNVVLWVPVLLAMVAGFGVLTVGWLLPPLGAMFGWVCDVNLTAIDWSIGAAARFRFGHFYAAGPSLGWLYVYYAVLAAPWFAPRWISPRRGLMLAGVWIVAGCAYTGLNQLQPSERALVCGFVSVGHGSAVVMELPDGQVWLYDAGRLGSPRAGARSIEAYLRSRRVSQIDALILSHADIDHYNAVPELLDKFSVAAVYVSPQMFREETQPLAILREAIAGAGVPIQSLTAGDVLVAGECVAKVLHPPPEGVEGNDNAQSIVLKVECDGRRVLLTGDLESAGTARLLASPPLDCDVLLAPHHGSSSSDPAAIVNWSTPEWAVISSGHPAAQTNNAYESLLGPRALNTADTGAVRARLSRDRVEVRAWRLDPWK